MAPTCKALRSATLTLTSASGFTTFPWPTNNSDGTLSHRCEIASEGGEITQYSSGNLTKSNHVSDASQLHNRSALKINAHRREIFHDEEVQTQLRCYGIVPPFTPFFSGEGEPLALLFLHHKRDWQTIFGFIASAKATETHREIAIESALWAGIGLTGEWGCGKTRITPEFVLFMNLTKGKYLFWPCTLR